ncbi:class I SAM-dependent methyltransferase [Enterocloster aldenensis]|uniref:class I SAM-dependent methyltransferase n=1 Tax=Enterocloster aldenensis TaxID=358742 RepID=UPI004027E0A3
MKPTNLEAINHSFEIQASGFESKTVNFTKEEYLNYTLSCVTPNRQDTILEVAAGTCICGRSFSPFVQTVVCLDATLPMLQIGKQEADKQELNNMVFIKGYAEELPFLDNSFDIVFSRLAFHHFTNVNLVFSEMIRVLKPGGKLVMIDMEAASEELRTVEDEIETLRDTSHVKNMSKTEMTGLFTSNGLSIQKCETTEIRQKLQSWLALTKTPEDIQKEIIRRMEADINGIEKTGFSPYMEYGEIYFNHKWILIVGRKPS